jgi:hypothetical protein
LHHEALQDRRMDGARTNIKRDSREDASAEANVNLRVFEQEDTPCGFVQSWGQRCTGHVVRVDCYEAGLRWSRGADGKWVFGYGGELLHSHSFCSEKGRHPPFRQDAVKVWNELTEELRRLLQGKSA